MKSEKGITLISLTVYIIAMLIIIGILAVVSKYFYTNMSDVKENIEPHTEYTTFNSYFTDEVNHEGIEVLECEKNYIVFSNGVQYTFVEANEGIYKNKVKICRGVKKCEFYYEKNGEKDTVTVTVNFGKGDRTTTYTLKWYIGKLM